MPRRYNRAGALGHPANSVQSVRFRHDRRPPKRYTVIKERQPFLPTGFLKSVLIVETKHYDLAVIGSGPAGEQAAITAAKFGKRVAVIERDPQPGGACIHTGTIPSKTLRETAVYLSRLRRRSIYGVRAQLKDGIGVGDLMYRKRIVIQNESRLTRNRLSRNEVELIEGVASFDDAHSLLVQSSENRPLRVTAERFVIATGSHPVRPPEVPFDGSVVLDSDTILQLDRIPRSLIVVGGGVIGSEYAAMFAALGVAVTIIEGRDRMLRFADSQIVDEFISYLRRMGVILRLNETVTSIDVVDNRAAAVLSSGAEISSEKLLFAMGRAGNLDGLGIENAGLTATARGYLTVDKHYRTSQAHIYAVGDVIGFPSLASTSMDQGRFAALHALDQAVPGSGIEHVLPYGIYTVPEISMVGKSEDEARHEGIDYEVGIAHYFETARGQINGDQFGMLKLVFEKPTRRLLGVHVFGERASELVHTGQAVLAFGGTIEYFIENVFNYPTLSELYRLAALNGWNRLTGQTN